MQFESVTPEFLAIESVMPKRIAAAVEQGERGVEVLDVVARSVLGADELFCGRNRERNVCSSGDAVARAPVLQRLALLQAMQAGAAIHRHLRVFAIDFADFETW